MVKDEVWEQAWLGRRKPWHAVPGQEILCIGCLEARLGRTLTKSDFANVPVNDPNQKHMSERLRARITTDQAKMTGAGMFDWMAWRMIEKLPPHAREAAWRKWIESEGHPRRKATL
jgi:hypothetical protein